MLSIKARHALFAGILTCVLFVVAIVILSKRPHEKPARKTIVVSILPIKFIVREIVGEDFDIEVLVPCGTSPETYEPQPQQVMAVQNASLLFVTGLLDFETNLVVRFGMDEKTVDLSKNIQLLEGECGAAEHSHHHHGVDPHIWTSPKQLKIMAANAYGSINSLSHSGGVYKSNYDELMRKIDESDKEVERKIKDAKLEYFFIYHPAMTYYSNDYGVRQIAIEHEGKEPSADRLRGLIDLARKEKVTKILYQREFSKAMVEAIAKEIGAEAVEIDPLAEDILQSISLITNEITQK